MSKPNPLRPAANRPEQIARDPFAPTSALQWGLGRHGEPGPRFSRPDSYSWLHDHARQMLGAFGRRAEIFSVHSAGDSGEGCEVIEFTTPCRRGRAAWTGHVIVVNGECRVACTLGWD